MKRLFGAAILAVTMSVSLLVAPVAAHDETSNELVQTQKSGGGYPNCYQHWDSAYWDWVGHPWAGMHKFEHKYKDGWTLYKSSCH